MILILPKLHHEDSDFTRDITSSSVFFSIQTAASRRADRVDDYAKRAALKFHETRLNGRYVSRVISVKPFRESRSTYCSGDSTAIIRAFIVMIGWAGLAGSRIDSKMPDTEFMALSNGYCRRQIHKSQRSHNEATDSITKPCKNTRLHERAEISMGESRRTPPLNTPRVFNK